MSGRLALCLAIAAASCQAGCDDREVVGVVPVKSVRVMAAIGGSITLTADDDPMLAGVSLRIPPGSLPRDLTVTIQRGGEDIAGTSGLPASPVVLVGPAETELLLPTHLGLPVKPGTTTDRVYIAVNGSAGRSRLASTPGPDAASAEAAIDRFGTFQAVRLPPGAAGPDAGAPPPPLPPPPPVPPRDAL